MSPIYIRPAREQAEHDRLILFLEAKHRQKYEVLTNRGESKDFALKVGPGTFFPDLILQDAKKLAGVIEIETGESTNNLEALAQWVHFGKAKAPFHLYVPVLMYDAARRFCEMNQVTVTEIWTYRPLMEGFDLVRVFHDPQAVAKSGKGPVAKVVAMPKPVEVPKIEPVAELIEEVVRLGVKAEQARAARMAKAKPIKTEVKLAPPPPKPAPVAKPAPPAPPAKAAPPAKPVAPAKPAAAAKPAAPAKPAAQAKPAAKAVAKAKPAKPVKKVKPAPKPAPKAAAKKAKPAPKPAPKPKPKPKPKAKPAPKPKPKAKAPAKAKKR